jgi:hypothetical protein
LLIEIVTLFARPIVMVEIVPHSMPPGYDLSPQIFFPEKEYEDRKIAGIENKGGKYAFTFVQTLWEKIFLNTKRKYL